MPEPIRPITKASQLGRNQLKAKGKAIKAAAKKAKKKAVAKVRAEVTARDKVDIIARDKGICMLCLKPTTIDDPPEVDHILPASQFPRKCESNMACLHKSCNIAKGARTDAVTTILRNIGHAIKPAEPIKPCLKETADRIAEIHSQPGAREPRSIPPAPGRKMEPVGARVYRPSRRRR